MSEITFTLPVFACSHIVIKESAISAGSLTRLRFDLENPNPAFVVS